MFKLKLLRIVFIFAAFVAANLCKKQRYVSLLHYLVGSGKDVDLHPYINQCRDMLFQTMEHQGHAKNNRYSVVSSTMYDGRGFSNRPELFYLIGAFNFEAERIYVDGSEMYNISIEDRYDWHPANDNGEYYTSPCNKWIVGLMRLFFGKMYFPKEGFPCNQPGISNQLWEDLSIVGALPFVHKGSSMIKGDYPFSDPQDPVGWRESISCKMF